jgi:hypothetical protein
MNELSREELISVLGLEAAEEILAQRESAGNTAGKVPFGFLTKIADVLGSDLGGFGEFVVGVEKGKDESGNHVITNKGHNLGKNFEFVLVSPCFYYKKFVPATTKDGQGRVFSSNIMKSLGDLDTAVDNQGNALPKSKEEKKAAGWKMVRMNAGLVRKNNKDQWTPCIWEVDGSMLFGFNNVLDKDTTKSRGQLSGVMNITTGMKKNGNIPFVVIDEDASTFTALPKDFFKDQAASITDITLKMKEYVVAKGGNTPNTAPVAPQASVTTEPEGW